MQFGLELIDLGLVKNASSQAPSQSVSRTKEVLFTPVGVRTEADSVGQIQRRPSTNQVDGGRP